MLMDRCRCLFFLWIICALWSCKKAAKSVNPKILVENVYVEFIKSDQVDINYKLSHLGYEETGVSFYKKSDPQNVRSVNAIRENGALKLSLQRLDPNTEYVFKVFFKQSNAQKVDTKDYTVKTLSAELAKFALEIKNTPINYDDKGSFTAEIEGENINNLNLSELDIKINNISVVLDYPVRISNDRYKMKIKGTVNPNNANNNIIGHYQGKEILFQSVPFVFLGERYWLSYKSTNLRGHHTSVFNNELYYFFDSKVYKWNDPGQRLQPVGSIPVGSIPDGYMSGIQFDGQIFFPIAEKSILSGPNDQSNGIVYPVGYFYAPGTDEWSSYIFKTPTSLNPRRRIQSNHYFVHKGELYLSYSLADDGGAGPTLLPNTDYFIYHYNKITKQFDSKINLIKDILDYRLISVNNELYLAGLTPVYDQGFRVSATFAVFKVNEQNFKMEEIYRAGTVTRPLTFILKELLEYEQKILIATSPNDFLIFDPSSRQLSPVFLRNSINSMYLTGFFIYNNQLHINADNKVHEISIVKGR